MNLFCEIARFLFCINLKKGQFNQGGLYETYGKVTLLSKAPYLPFSVRCCCRDDTSRNDRSTNDKQQRLRWLFQRFKTTSIFVRIVSGEEPKYTGLCQQTAKRTTKTVSQLQIIHGKFQHGGRWYYFGVDGKMLNHYSRWLSVGHRRNAQSRLVIKVVMVLCTLWWKSIPWRLEAVNRWRLVRTHDNGVM